MDPLFSTSFTGVLILAGFAVLWIAFVRYVEHIQKNRTDKSKDQVSGT